MHTVNMKMLIVATFSFAPLTIEGYFSAFEMRNNQFGQSQRTNTMPENVLSTSLNNRINQSTTTFSNKETLFNLDCSSSRVKVPVLTPDCRANISTSSTFHLVTQQPPVAVSLRKQQQKTLAIALLPFWALASDTPDYLAWQTNWQLEHQRNGG